MTESSNKIEVRDLRKAFAGKIVLDDVDLEVRRGESLVVIGGSGTGKSVLIKYIIGILHPDSGSIKVDGEEAVGMGAQDREAVTAKFGMLFQGPALFESPSVSENVSFGLMAGHGASRADAREIATEKLRQVGLGPDVAEFSPSELSGGMQKRVGLARAIATAPEILYFDESTTGLDPIVADVINDLIIQCVRELGATALSITHDMVSARKIADRIAMIHQGKIIGTGAVDDIDYSGNPFVDQLINGRAEGPMQMEIGKP